MSIKSPFRIENLAIASKLGPRFALFGPDDLVWSTSWSRAPELRREELRLNRAYELGQGAGATQRITGSAKRTDGPTIRPSRL